VRWHYLSVRPGITGLWQVSGRNNTTYAERVAFDKRYVEKRSAWLDVRILFKTVQVVLARDGAR
jgi:lipopolysaccharide/colanic/teichoic acid biosynthesis glycosyltransferase